MVLVPFGMVEYEGSIGDVRLGATSIIFARVSKRKLHIQTIQPLYRIETSKLLTRDDFDGSSVFEVEQKTHFCTSLRHEVDIAILAYDKRVVSGESVAHLLAVVVESIRIGRIDNRAHRVGSESCGGVDSAREVGCCGSGSGATRQEVASTLCCRAVVALVATTHVERTPKVAFEERAVQLVPRLGKHRLYHLRHRDKRVVIFGQHHSLHGQHRRGELHLLATASYREKAHRLLAIPRRLNGAQIERLVK